MNQQDNTTQIADEMLDAFFASKHFRFMAGTVDMIKSWEAFKASHSSSEKVDWEIVRMKSEVDCKFPTVYFDLQPNGKFVSEEWPNEEFDLKEDLLENKIGKKYSIVSVRRLSDGEVFNVGDTVRYCPVSRYGSFIIETIWINSIDKKRCMVTDKDQSLVETIDGNLEKIKAPILEEKPILFTTEDGVALTNRGEQVWAINRKTFKRESGNGNSIGTWLNGWYTTSDFPNPKNEDLSKILALIKERFAIFSTEKAANEYVIMNKSILNLNEIDTVLAKEVRECGTIPQDSLRKAFHSLKQLASSKIEGGEGI